jgi:hypothetical protein
MNNTSLLHPQLISVGRSVIIEDYVVIDALSQKGVTALPEVCGDAALFIDSIRV